MDAKKLKSRQILLERMERIKHEYAPAGLPTMTIPLSFSHPFIR